MDIRTHLAYGNLREFANCVTLAHRDVEAAMLSARTMLASWYGGHQSRMYRLAVEQGDEWIREDCDETS